MVTFAGGVMQCVAVDMLKFVINFLGNEYLENIVFVRLINFGVMGIIFSRIKKRIST